jgi:N-acetylmuramoyl-L-alanine amidase
MADDVLRLGATGEAVRDVQLRLHAAGHPSDDELGTFGEATERAVRTFQEARGLEPDGRVGVETWAALVESGFSLGDRLLYHSTPNLRGDDVAQLQRRLNALGFDAGREDGILGPETGEALREFQRNAGLSLDGIAGPATVAALARVGGLAAGSVAAVRERDRLREPGRLAGHRIYLAVAPGFEQIGSVVTRGLGALGAQIIADTSGQEDGRLAARANRWGADLFLALRAGEPGACRCLYFASGDFRSEAGYRVARAVRAELDADADPEAGICGRAQAALRDTRMAAVICALVAQDDAAAMAGAVARAAELGGAVVTGIRRGVEDQPSTISL